MGDFCSSTYFADSAIHVDADMLVLLTGKMASELASERAS